MLTSLPPRVYSDLIGLRFQKDGRGPDAYDCMGLFVKIQRRLGRHMPDYPSLLGLDINALAAETKQAFDLIPAESFAPGDGILIRSLDPRWHIGTVICIDVPTMIHAYEPAGGVVIDRFDRDLWVRRIEGFYRWREVAERCL